MGIGYRIKQARERLSLTQKELAYKLGITASSITNYENETSHPKEPIMYKLIDALEVDANFLFQDSVEIKKTPQPSNWDTDRTELIDNFDGMNEAGRSELLKHSRLLLNSNQYKKCGLPVEHHSA